MLDVPDKMHKGVKKKKVPLKMKIHALEVNPPPASAYSITEQHNLPAVDFSLLKLKPSNANQQILFEVTSS